MIRSLPAVALLARIMATLQEQSTPFDLMLYPGQRHGIRTPAKEVQLWETYLAFFKRTLGTGDR